jgi:hypothetical protein
VAVWSGSLPVTGRRSLGASGYTNY